MDAKTGQIFLNVPPDEAKKRDLVPIPEGQAEQVINMNRKQRRAWAARQRRAGSHSSSPTEGP